MILGIECPSPYEPERNCAMNVFIQEKSPRRMPGIPEHVQEYFLCILFHLLLPFVPLVTEVSLQVRCRWR